MIMTMASSQRERRGRVLQLNMSMTSNGIISQCYRSGKYMLLYLFTLLVCSRYVSNFIHIHFFRQCLSSLAMYSTDKPAQERVEIIDEAVVKFNETIEQLKKDQGKTNCIPVFYAVLPDACTIAAR